MFTHSRQHVFKPKAPVPGDDFVSQLINQINLSTVSQSTVQTCHQSIHSPELAYCLCIIYLSVLGNCTRCVSNDRLKGGLAK